MCIGPKRDSILLAASPLIRICQEEKIASDSTRLKYHFNETYTFGFAAAKVWNERN
jgi:hypothetical protein